MTIIIPKNSRLKMAKFISDYNHEFWTRTSMVEIPSSKDDKTHTVDKNDRIDLIAKRYYKDSTLWYLVAWVNGLVDLPCSLVPGMKLRIPDVTTIRKYLK